MSSKKFKLNSELKSNLEILDSKLSERVVGGMRFTHDLELTDPCGAQCEVTCAHYCLANCDDFCGSTAYKE